MVEHDYVNAVKEPVENSSSGRHTSDDDSNFEAITFREHERRNHSFSIGKGKWGFRVNPVSFVASVILIWGFAIWCMVWQDFASVELNNVQKWITDTMTWAYMLTQQVWIVFLLVLYVSKYGGMKLGKPDDDPEFPTASWFMMMFSAGIGIGLFFFGVAEPVLHYEPCNGNPPAGPGSACLGNRYAQLPDDDRAQWAMNIAYFDWGIHAWVVYCVVGLLLAAVVYRKDLPMTMKSAFYPIIGDKIFGWMGDILDTVSVVTTLFGVCTSLGLGVVQLNAGFHRLNSDIPENSLTQIIIIWCVTAAATVSVVSGVKVGIRRLSEINWLLAQFICFIALFQEDTWYLLNNICQSIGFYFQKFIGLGFHTDTFQQAPALTVDGLHITAVAPDGSGSDREWMNAWTIFYWGWWIAWAPFVGMFIAKISRGRTVRQIINGAMFGPVLYGFIWFGIFGGIGLRIERQAANLGVSCEEGVAAGPSEYFQSTPDGAFTPLDLPMVEVDGLQYWRLSCRSTTDMWFDMLTNFPMHHFYWGVSMASLILYFVTSSDSGSLVIDCLTSNGNPDPPIFQRVFWSCTEGAVATALLVVGGNDSLTALQAVSIVAGVPYTIVICFMCVALWEVLATEYKIEHGIPMAVFNTWVTGTIDTLDYPTFSASKSLQTLVAVVAPWYYAGYGAGWACESSKVAFQAVYAFLFYTWPILLLGNIGQRGLWAIAWTSFVAFTLHLAYVRAEARSKRNIHGSVGADVVVSMILYPFVAVQLYDEAKAAEANPKEERPPLEA